MSETFVMRMIGSRDQPSARIVPFDSRPIVAAVSRLMRYPTKVPSFTAQPSDAGTPSSSKPKVPRPPGVVESMRMFTISLP